MFRSILIPTAVLLSITTLFAQQEIPAELALKLNDKAEKLFPNNAKAQDKWLNEQNENYMLLPMLTAPAGNEEIFNKHIKPLAEKKFELDFTSKAKFIQDMTEGLMTIDAYKNVFGENTALFNKMKTDVLKSNPEDFKKAAKQFEEQSQMMIEIDSLPRNSLVDDALFYGLKAAANKKFPNDFAKQKTYLENILNVFIQYEVLAANVESNAEASAKEESETPQQVQANYQEILMNAQVFIRGENGDGIGIISEIKGKPVVIFPKSFYDANGMLIVNSVDEPVSYSDVLVAKNAPYAIAVVKSMPNGMKPIPMASTEELKKSIEKTAFLFLVQDNSINLRSNSVVSLKNNSLNLSRKLLNGTKQGTGLFLFDEKGNAQILGICITEEKDLAFPDFSNKTQTKHFSRGMQNKTEKVYVSRVDDNSGWQKIDQAKFAEEVALLKKISDNNNSFLSFFLVNNLKDLANLEVFNNITNKYSKIFKEEIQNEPSLEKNIKNMISETINIMGRDIRKVNISEISPVLKSEFEFQLKFRNAMIDSLKSVLKKNQFKRFDFEDIRKTR